MKQRFEILRYSFLVLFMALFAAFSCSREDSSLSLEQSDGPIIFTATGSGSGSQADTKSSASDSGTCTSGDESQSYTIFYDFDKGENVSEPSSDDMIGEAFIGEDGAYTQSSDTRFSGQVFNVSTNQSERIDWVSGDKVTIAEAVRGTSSQYTVTGNQSSNNVQATISLSPSSGGLFWRMGWNHRFISLYPSTATLGISNPAISYSSPSSTSYYMDISGNYSGGTVMPSVQYCTKVNAGRTYKSPKTPSGKAETWYEPDMKYAYMVACKEIYPLSPQNNINLTFYSHFSSVEIKLVKPYYLSNYPVKLRKATLKAGSGYANATSLSGTPNITLTGTSGLKTRVCSSSSTAYTSSGGAIEYSYSSGTYGNTITMNFKQSNGSADQPVLDRTKPTSFTFLMLPAKNLTQLELILELDVNGLIETKTLKLRSKNMWIPLAAGKKLTVSNTEHWTPDLYTPLTVEPINTAATITINNPKGLTYKWSTDGGVTKNQSKATSITISATKGQKVALFQNSRTALNSTIRFSAPCYVYGNVMSLASENNFAKETSTVQDQFYRLFNYTNDKNLTSHPKRRIMLPATTLATRCYGSMFQSCKNLTIPPALPAKTLAPACYEGMFLHSGLKSLPADYVLPATTLATRCYKEMFASTNLTSLPSGFVLPAKTLAKQCYNGMFSYTQLTTLPEGLLPATTLAGADSCYVRMFTSCKSLTKIPAKLLPATTLAPRCYDYMFAQSGLTTLPSGLLPATKLTPYCYYSMFYRCYSLASIPTGFMKATTVAEGCCSVMFEGAIITTIPSDLLPAKTLAPFCYSHMFWKCEKLNKIPANLLQATTLAESCYGSMFAYCSSLKSVPSGLLPVKKLAKYCYSTMFADSGLTGLPSGFLPATTLAENCYRHMFSASKLASVPANLLPATTLAPFCYVSMFRSCVNLQRAPDLPATQSAASCYEDMFGFCTKLNYLRCNLLNTSTNSIRNILNSVAASGTLRRNPNAPANLWSGEIPTGWTVSNY